MLVFFRGDTSTDLVHLDKRLLGTILIEEADDALHHFHLGPDHREGAARISTTTSPTVVRSGDDLVDLADFLDEIYNGAGKFAEDFYTAVRLACPFQVSIQQLMQERELLSTGRYFTRIVR